MSKKNLPVKSLDDRVASIHRCQNNILGALSQFAAWVVLCGMELNALKKEVGHGNWMQFFEEKLERPKFSLRTADVYMKVGDECKSRLLKNWTKSSNSQNSANLDFLSTSPTALLPAQLEQLTTEIQKITDGRTMQELMLDLGIIKAPHGSGLHGGDNTFQKWLRENHPELEGTKLHALAPEIRAEWDAWCKASHDEYMKTLYIQDVKKAWNGILKELGRHGLKKKTWGLLERHEIEYIYGVLIDLKREIQEALKK